MDSSKTKILIVDDEKNICEIIRLYVEKEGFSTICAYDGDEAVRNFKEEKPDIVLLDIMLPKKDGWQVCREIRGVSNAPIIMLTAKGELFDKVLGLELGADDYVVKPFEPKELVARIKAVLRRCEYNPDQSESKEGVLKFNGLTINRETYEVYLGEERLELPPKEFELLYFLAQNVNRVFTRDQLLNEIWGYEFFGDSRTVDVHIKRIREKIEREGKEQGWQLKTVWGVGYKFELSSQV
ncbi:MAG: response regulator transcription factor [Clostridia bacterium]|nr:response regulator transcription factor [Clostridia bacterium]